MPQHKLSVILEQVISNQDAPDLKLSTALEHLAIVILNYLMNSIPEIANYLPLEAKFLIINTLPSIEIDKNMYYHLRNTKKAFNLKDITSLAQALSILTIRIAPLTCIEKGTEAQVFRSEYLLRLTVNELNTITLTVRKNNKKGILRLTSPLPIPSPKLQAAMAEQIDEPGSLKLHFPHSSVQIRPWLEGCDLFNYLREGMKHGDKLNIKQHKTLLLLIQLRVLLLHKHGYVHRDLKPENIILNVDLLSQNKAEKAAYIIDFHRATEINAEITATAGTPGFIPQTALALVNPSDLTNKKPLVTVQHDIFPLTIIAMLLLQPECRISAFSIINTAYPKCIEKYKKQLQALKKHSEINDKQKLLNEKHEQESLSETEETQYYQQEQKLIALEEKLTQLNEAQINLINEINQSLFGVFWKSPTPLLSHPQSSLEPLLDVIRAYFIKSSVPNTSLPNTSNPTMGMFIRDELAADNEMMLIALELCKGIEPQLFSQITTYLGTISGSTQVQARKDFASLVVQALIQEDKRPYFEQMRVLATPTPSVPHQSVMSLSPLTAFPWLTSPLNNAINKAVSAPSSLNSPTKLLPFSRSYS